MHDHSDAIPRYAPPTPAELEEMDRGPSPDEWMGRCVHCDACARLWSIYVGPLSGKPDSQMATTIDCGECLAYVSQVVPTSKANPGKPESTTPDVSRRAYTLYARIGAYSRKDLCDMVARLEAENVKLRELVVDAWGYINHPADASWTHTRRREARNSLSDRMRELGIEVDDAG